MRLPAPRSLPVPRSLSVLRSLQMRLVFSMTLLLCGGLLLVSVLHGLESEHGHVARLGRLLLGDELPEPWQDLAVLAPFALVMLVLISLVAGWSLRGLRRASLQASRVGAHRPDARIAVAGLPGEVIPLVEAVNAALGRLATAFDMQRRFTADAAHEMRTPLAVLSLRLQRARYHNILPEWEAVEADLATMRRLIEDLLDLARKEVRSRPRQPVNLSRVAREAAAAIEPLTLQAGRVLQVELPDALWIEGNPHDLRDMVRNLVANAFEHGRGRITLSLASRPGDAVTLEVSDEGPGVALAQREAVFERFRKGSAGSAGSGLGLAIVRAVAQAHAGSVEFIAGAACCIRVVLPVEPAQPATATR